MEYFRDDVSWRDRKVAGVGWRWHRTTLARRWERDVLSGRDGYAHGRAGWLGSDVFHRHGATALPRALQGANLQYRRIQLRRPERRLPIHREPLPETFRRASARYSAERDGSGRSTRLISAEHPGSSPRQQHFLDHACNDNRR